MGFHIEVHPYHLQGYKNHYFLHTVHLLREVSYNILQLMALPTYSVYVISQSDILH